MRLTIALSGMDSATETALRAAFAGANAQLGDACALVAESESQHVIVDMDSMYGPMSWLRLHAAGKQVIGLTSAPRVQTHFRLGRPFDEQAIVGLLREIADSTGVTLAGASADPGASAAANPAPATIKEPAAPAPAPTAQPPREEHRAPAASPAEAPPPATETAEAGPATDADDEAAPGGSSTLAPSASAAPDGERAMVDWIADPAMRGRVRYRNATGPTLLIDFDARQYHGPSTLKPLAQYFDAPVARTAFEPVADDAWVLDAPATGPAQPLSRLHWLGALLAGDGALAPGYDPDARYTLNKWPQTEREYPRHFRIATAMMKGPATLAEIAAASGLPAEEIHRFVNANLATGYAEPFVETPPEPADAGKSGGFFSRLRGR